MRLTFQLIRILGSQTCRSFYQPTESVEQQLGVKFHIRNVVARIMYHIGFMCCVCMKYSSPNIVRVIKSRRMRWAGHVARMGEERGAYRFLVGKPEGKRPLGRPRRRWVDNIRMDLQEVGCGCVDWIGLAQDRDSWRTLVNAEMNLRVP